MRICGKTSFTLQNKSTGKSKLIIGNCGHVLQYQDHLCKNKEVNQYKIAPLSLSPSFSALTQNVPAFIRSTGGCYQ